ncbi:MAG: hypothetical protein QF554_00955 [Dehalococcoidia bacterium]|nr:hypothetical protein [Dehalococcoidia bacterium]
MDSHGNLYVSGSNVVRRVDAITRVITTVVGTGESGYDGDGRLAIEAQLSAPVGVAIDSEGNLYVADSFSNRIRRVDATTGIISTVAGTGDTGGGGDGGLATEAQIYTPNDVVVDAEGHIFVAAFSDNRVRRVDAVTGVISTVAGTREWGYDGDGGPAGEAIIRGPTSLSLDAEGNLYIADRGNGLIRVVVGAASPG